MNISWDHLEPLEQMKEGYEPADQEVIEYAKYLGLQLPQDQKYLNIAKQGLVASLPPFWQACEAPNGQLYFRNRKTRQIVQENPLDDLYRQKIQQMKQIQCTYGVQPINQESALKQSSGVMKSSERGRRSDLLKLSSKRPNVNDPNPSSSLIEHHITEESVYSEDDSPKESQLMQKRIFEKEELTEQKKKIMKVKQEISHFVPLPEHIISSYHSLPTNYEKLANYMSIDELERLIEMRENVEKKKKELEKLRTSKAILAKAYAEIRI